MEDGAGYCNFFLCTWKYEDRELKNINQFSQLIEMSNGIQINTGPTSFHCLYT